MSMRLCLAMICCAAAFTAALSATSSTMDSALPKVCKWARALAFVADVRPEITTWAPAFTNSIAPAKPIPLPPPVIHATWPFKDVVMLSPCVMNGVI
jgi:hypothetical protein